MRYCGDSFQPQYWGKMSQPLNIDSENALDAALSVSLTLESAGDCAKM